MTVEIRETTITPKEGAAFVVQIHISDAAPDDESASFVLTLSAEISEEPHPSLRRIQRTALMVAQVQLDRMIAELE